MPGRPSRRMLWPLTTYVADDLAGAGHRAADSHGEASVMRPSDRLRIAEMRWSVRSMPARLSSPNCPTLLATCSRSSGGDRPVGEQDLPAGDACFRLSTQVKHSISSKLRRVCALVQRARQVGGQRAREKLDLLVPVGGSR